MAKQEIVKLLILKAYEYGFDFKQIWKGLPDDYKWEVWSGDKVIYLYNDSKSFKSGNNYGWKMAYETLFFSHHFATAFAKYIIKIKYNNWGKDLITGDTVGFVMYKLLTNMVMEKDLVTYLMQFLKGGLNENKA